MRSNKLLTLLKTLEPDEFRKFYQFLKSPFYNKSQHVIDLYLYLHSYYPAFNSTRLTKERVFQKLFPDTAFNLNKMRKLMSALTQLIEEYLISLELRRNDYEKKKILGDVYKGRNLGALYQKNTRQLIAQLNKPNVYDPAYYLELKRLNQDLFFHTDTNKHQSGAELLNQTMQNLDAYYFLSKLQLHAEMTTRENIFAEKHRVRLLKESIDQAQQFFLPDNPLCQIYIHIIELHQDAGEEDTFSSTWTLFKKFINQIDRQQQQIILNHLLNHCIRLINQGASEYKSQLFELYQFGIEHELIIENNQITRVTFSNIISLGSSLGAFDWVQTFMDKHLIYLKEEIKEDTRALCIALLNFNKKEFQEAVKPLLNYRFSDILNLLKARCLLLRIYYEQFLLDDTSGEFLLDQATAFEKFIRRHKKISPNKSDAYLNFIKFTKKLALYQQSNKELDELKQALEEQPSIMYKEWLLEKMKIPS